MMNAWAQVYNCSGESVGQIPRWNRLTVRHLINEPADVTFELDGRDQSVPLLGLDYQVQFWRSNPAIGLQPYKELDCLCRPGQWTRGQDGRFVYMTKMWGLEHLLSRRCLLGGTDESYYDGMHTAEDCMKISAGVQCGVGGLRSALAIPIPGLTVLASESRGGSCTGYQRGTNLLTHLQSIAKAHDMCFRISSDTPMNFMFDAWPAPYGQDRTATGVDHATGRNASGSIPVMFSLNKGNLAALTYASIRDTEGTVGVEINTMATKYSPHYADSPLNHWEVPVVPQAGESSGSALTNGLQQTEMRQDVKTSLIQSRGCAYGHDYGLGDMVSIVISGPNLYRELSQTISGITWTVEYRQGEPVEEIGVDLTASLMPSQSALKETLGNLTRRVKYLELSA